MSVAVVTPAAVMASAAARLRARMESSASASPSAGARPIWRAKLSVPVPMGLVRTSRSPGLALLFTVILRGSTTPVTAKPNLISRSLMLWPPRRATPASRSLSTPPWSIRFMMRGLSDSMGKATIDRAVRGLPPMA